MTLSSSCYRAWILIGIAAIASVAAAQRPSNPGAASRTSTPNRNAPTPDVSTQPVFISGKVVLEGGGTLPEPVAIERVCNNVNRREGYTDVKGQFQFQLGTNTTFQDASETDTRMTPAPTRQTGLNRTQRPLDSMTGCEFRAVLAGYQSSVAMIRTAGDGWQYDVGTIFLKRIGDAPGTTISVTSMAAPKKAMQAYEKAEKAMEDNPGDAEKELHKAVQIYPQFAAAWTLLGDIDYQKQQMQLAREEYSRAVNADPQYVKPAYGLVMIATQEKKWSEVAQLSDQVLKLNALAYPLAYFFNAAANYNQQKYDEAEQSAQKFKALDTQHHHPDVCLLLSQIYSRKGDYAGAARELRDYLAAAPNAPDAESLKVEAKRLEDLSVSANAVKK